VRFRHNKSVNRLDKVGEGSLPFVEEAVIMPEVAQRTHNRGSWMDHHRQTPSGSDWGTTPTSRTGSRPARSARSLSSVTANPHLEPPGLSATGGIDFTCVKTWQVISQSTRLSRLLARILTG